MGSYNTRKATPSAKAETLRRQVRTTKYATTPQI